MELPCARKVLCSVRLSSLITSSAICSQKIVQLKIVSLICVTQPERTHAPVQQIQIYNC